MHPNTLPTCHHKVQTVSLCYNTPDSLSKLQNPSEDATAASRTDSITTKPIHNNSARPRRVHSTKQCCLHGLPWWSWPHSDLS